MDRASKEIITVCCISAILLCVALIALDRSAREAATAAPNLECSVDDTLSFVAFNVTSWDMNAYTLTLTSEEGDKPFVMARALQAGETCKEMWP